MGVHLRLGKHKEKNGAYLAVSRRRKFLRNDLNDNAGCLDALNKEKKVTAQLKISKKKINFNFLSVYLLCIGMSDLSRYSIRIFANTGRIMRKRSSKNSVLSFLVGISAFSAVAANLQSGQTLSPGQQIYSDNGKYRLVMQSDGNLVYYKTSDSSVRWNSQTHGNAGATVVMQGDGNLVVYAQGVAKWNSQTHNHPGAYLATQTDGNLVVYAAGTQAALWNIGVDPSEQDPSQPGAVVGRDLDIFGLGSLGHIGVYDGGNIYEALNEGGNAIKYNSLANFKSRSRYWGVASTNIPSYSALLCLDTSCRVDQANLFGAGWENVSSRYGVVRRAYQIYVIGAQYTLGASYTRAEPRIYSTGGVTTSPSHQGLYRCDTFVVDLFETISIGQTYAPGVWVNFVHEMKYGLMLPTTIFNKLKAYL